MRTPIAIAVACLAIACTVDASTCVKSHKVVAGETCISIAKKSSISASKLISLNPSINSKCTNLRKGSVICVKKSSSSVKAAKKTTTKKTTKKTTTKKTTKKTTTKKTTTKKTTTKKTTTTKKSTTTSTKKTTTKPNTTTSTKKTTTKPNTTTKTTTSAGVPTATPNLTYNYGLTAAVNSKTDFCVFLPSSPGGMADNGGKIDIDAIANSEKSAVAFCLKPTANAAGARTLPVGFITSAHYFKNTTAQYVQVTGKLNPKLYSLSTKDQGGQYDNHGKGSPPLSMCYGYKYYVNLIEPDKGDYCMRCCNTYVDCNAGRSEYGCARVVQNGVYD